MGNCKCQVRWEKWQEKFEKISQQNTVTRDKCTIDITRDVVDMKNWKKEVDSFKGRQHNREIESSIQLDMVKQLVDYVL
jgi:hypothetical protein